MTDQPISPRKRDRSPSPKPRSNKKLLQSPTYRQNTSQFSIKPKRNSPSPAAPARQQAQQPPSTGRSSPKGTPAPSQPELGMIYIPPPNKPPPQPSNGRASPPKSAVVPPKSASGHKYMTFGPEHPVSAHPNRNGNQSPLSANPYMHPPLSAIGNSKHNWSTTPPTGPYGPRRSIAFGSGGSSFSSSIGNRQQSDDYLLGISPSPSNLPPHHLAGPNTPHASKQYLYDDLDPIGGLTFGGPESILDQLAEKTRKGEDLGLEIGDFEMLDTLGTGTFGKVLLVRCRPPQNQSRLPLTTDRYGNTSSYGGPVLPPGMPQYFAMKVLAKTEVVKLKQVEHINCERTILGAVDHPGVVNLFCTFQDERNLYILLEFVQGGELFSHLRRAGRFTTDVARFYAANIVLVLEYLHERNIIYRDLKPENLLLDHMGYLKVTDFGFAKHVPDRTFTLCGTPEYLAPEIIQSSGHGKAADWWAFGVLLFEMLCGYPPFFDANAWGIYEKILAGSFAFPAHVDPMARDLIRRLLAHDRSKRLGNLAYGSHDVKTHPFFAGVDWAAVEMRSVMAPIIPRIKSQHDSDNFEQYPAIDIKDLPGLARAKGAKLDAIGADPHQDLFKDF